jgi:uncharacterized repeat protein (TIGR01451 family)
VTQDEIDAGGFLSNTVTASSNQAGPVQDNHQIPISQAASLNILKDAQESSVDAAGDVIHYSITVRNTGNVTLTGVTVTDPFADVVPGIVRGADAPGDGDNDLEVGETWTYTAQHTVTQAEIDAGQDLVNTATADSNQTGPDTDDATVPVSQAASLTLTKSASPTVYSAAGQVITYTYGLTNSGNVTLTGPFVITDDKVGTVTCGTSSSTLAPGASFGGTCTATYTIQAGDVKPTNDGEVTNTATATAKDPNGQTVTSNQAQATVRQIAATGKIAPTATTCQDFKNGTAGNLTEILYTLKGQKINSVAPGVLFYYSLVTVPAGTHTISVAQTTSPSFTLFGIQQDQAVLWSSNCTKVQSNATGSFTVTNTTSTTYIVGIKYDPGTVVGLNKPGGNGQVTYTFTTKIDGSDVVSSPDSLVLKQKPKK